MKATYLFLLVRNFPNAGFRVGDSFCMAVCLPRSVVSEYYPVYKVCAGTLPEVLQACSLAPTRLSIARCKLIYIVLVIPS